MYILRIVVPIRGRKDWRIHRSGHFPHKLLDSTLTLWSVAVFHVGMSIVSYLVPYGVNEYWIDQENKPIPVFSVVYTIVSEETPDSSLFDVLSLFRLVLFLKIGKIRVTALTIVKAGHISTFLVHL